MGLDHKGSRTRKAYVFIIQGKKEEKKKRMRGIRKAQKEGCRRSGGFCAQFVWCLGNTAVLWLTRVCRGNCKMRFSKMNHHKMFVCGDLEKVFCKAFPSFFHVHVWYLSLSWKKSEIKLFNVLQVWCASTPTSPSTCVGCIGEARWVMPWQVRIFKKKKIRFFFQKLSLTYMYFLFPFISLSGAAQRIFRVWRGVCEKKLCISH